MNRTVDVDQVVLHARGIELSGLLAEPDETPRALVLALHGGGMTAGYFHGSPHPDLSLLRLGRALGFSVLALDRPGYGRSRSALPRGQKLQDQAATVFDALDDFAGAHDMGGDVFVVGHSFGLKLALHPAADPRGGALLGLDGSGAVYRYQPGLKVGAARRKQAPTAASRTTDRAACGNCSGSRTDVSAGHVRRWHAAGRAGPGDRSRGVGSLAAAAACAGAQGIRALSVDRRRP